MAKLARHVGIALGSSVAAWLVATLVAGWLFGSGNILVWLVAGSVGVSVYLTMLGRDRQAR